MLTCQVSKRTSLLFIFLSLFLISSPLTLVAQKDKSEKKYIICHTPPRNAGKTITIEVSEKALKAHLDHGDSFGPCVESEEYTGTVITKYPAIEKTKSLLSSELESLVKFVEVNGSAASDEVFIINNGKKVLVEIIAISGQHELVKIMLSDDYNINEYLQYGINDQIITVLFPIDKLPELKLKENIREVKQVNTPVSNSGITTSLGDIAQQSENARNAFNVKGADVKIGVISDSYDTKGQAQYDVLNGDLPNSVHVLYDFPSELGTFFSLSDEGRAMMQIIHDVAPDAALAFRSGFISGEDMAVAIDELADPSLGDCDIIVDDLTHIGEPFFKDGMIARTVNSLPADVFYITAAGNFGDNSHAGTFNPSSTNPLLHDFNTTGQEDTIQSISLGDGYYTIVLQWDDDFYSLRDVFQDGNDGAQNDLDIFLVDDLGNIIVDSNNDNLGKDPIETMNFSVKDGGYLANIMIKRASGTENVDFKYIVFRGHDFKFNEYETGTSTIMGHANSEKAITVGAVLYDYAPAFRDSLNIASFSSRGGTPVEGVVRNKPDIAAPNGINTTVELGGVDYDNDGFPNFFGTSASAPHVAGVIALLMESKAKFSEVFSIEDVLFNSAIDMYETGFDFVSGNGFIQADAAIMAIPASPEPEIISLIVPEGVVPGVVEFTVTIEGKNFTENTYVKFNESNILPENTTFHDNSKITALIPEFTEDPALEVITPAITNSGLDGGSDLMRFSSLTKKLITIKANSTSKKYGEIIPEFTDSVFVDGVPIEDTELTRERLELESDGVNRINFTTTATSSGIVFKYIIQPSLNEQYIQPEYKYEFKSGILSIEKMPLIIKPNDLHITYGDKIEDITFQYIYDDSKIDPDERGYFLEALETAHQSTFTGEDTIAIVNRGRLVVNRGRLVVNGTGWMASYSSLSNRGRLVVNGNVAMDIDYTILEDYQYNPTGTLTNRGRLVVNAESLVNGEAIIADRGRLVVNDGALVNSDEETDEFADLAVIIDTSDYAISSLFSINLITGYEVNENDEDTISIVPGAFSSTESQYFDITYELGNLWVSPAELNVEVHDKWIVNGDPIPEFSSTITGFVLEETVDSVFSSITYEPTTYSGTGIYPIIPSFEYVDWINYNIVPDPIIPGDLLVADINELLSVVSTRGGLKLLDNHGNTLTLINSNSRNVDVSENYVYIHGEEWIIEEYSLFGNFLRNISIPSAVTQNLISGQYLNFVVLPNRDFALLDNRNDKIYFINSLGDYLTVDILPSADPILQNMDGIVVDNNLIVSEDGYNQLIKVDLQSYTVSNFRDLSHLSGWLSAIDYQNGTYYLCQDMEIWAFTEESEGETLIATLPENNITGIMISGYTAYVTINFSNRVYKVDILTGNYEVLAEGLIFAEDIEKLWPRNTPIQINGKIAIAPFNGGPFEGDTDLVVINSDGTNPIILVEGTDFVRDPEFSPDGTEILYSLQPPESPALSNLWKIKTDGSSPPVQMTSDNQSFGGVYSPDGSKIAFTDRMELYIMDADGLSDPEQITSTGINKFGLRYAPNGLEIYYIESKDGGNDIWKVNVIFNEATQTYDRTPITNDLTYYTGLDFLKDGSRIIYSKSPGGGQSGDAIGSMNPDGSDQVILRQAPISSGPSVSPDNTKIAYIESDTNVDLYVMDIDGNNYHEIYTQGFNTLQPSWGIYPDELGFGLDQLNVSSLTEGDITIYPNPVIDMLTIVHANGADLNISIEVADNQGILLDIPITVTKLSEEFEANLTVLEAGEYFLYINDGNTIETFRIIKL